MTYFDIWDIDIMFRTFLEGRGSLLEQDSYQGIFQHLRESELLDMLQQCEHEEVRF